MQIVIDIPNDIYNDIMTHNRERREGAKSAYYFEGLIQNSTPLPKGHGDIVDADKAFDLLNKEIDKHDKMMAKYQPYTNNQIPLWWWKGICKDLTIVEADKESEE